MTCILEYSNLVIVDLQLYVSAYWIVVPVPVLEYAYRLHDRTHVSISRGVHMDHGMGGLFVKPPGNHYIIIVVAKQY